MLLGDLSIISRGGEIFMARCLNDFGIVATEVLILMYLYEHENPRQEDISDYFMLDKGSIAKTLQKLEKKGMIARRVNADDQREKVIRVTEKGYCVRDVCMNLIRLWHETMFNGVSEEEAQVFERILSRMSSNVSAGLERWEAIYGKGNKTGFIDKKKIGYDF